jgi:HD superfamily phosphohydrolase
MRVADPLYGEVSVDAPVLAELLVSPSLQRLRGVHQSGAVVLVRPERAVTRWEHSVGTMLLVARLGGTVQEQAAALVHDAGHGAFSHVIDRVFAASDDGWHEREGVAWLARTEVPAVLQRHGLDPERTLAPHAWPLLDRPAPDLCADRIDYALRDALNEGLVTSAEVATFLDALVVAGDGVVAVSAAAQGAWFAERFARLVQEVFLDPVGIWADWTLATAIRRALDRGRLGEDALHATDAELLTALRATGDPEVTGRLDALVPGAAAAVVAAGDGRPDIVVFPKPRAVDPHVLGADGLPPVRASAFAPEIAASAAALRARAAAGIGVRARRPGAS